MKGMAGLLGLDLDLVHLRGHVMLSTRVDGENAPRPWPLLSSHTLDLLQPGFWLQSVTTTQWQVVLSPTGVESTSWVLTAGTFSLIPDDSKTAPSKPTDDAIPGLTRQRCIDLYALFKPLLELISRLCHSASSRDVADSCFGVKPTSEDHDTLTWFAGPDMQINYFSKVWLDFTGRSLEEEAGEGWAKSIHPDDLDSVWKVYSESFKARRHYTMDYRLRRYDGEYRWIQEDGIPKYDNKAIFQGFLGYCVDVTDRKRIEQSLKQRIQCLTAPTDFKEDLHFEDLLNLDEVQTLQDEFCMATGVASMIVATDGRAITKPSNFCRYCEIIRGTEAGSRNCRESDATLGKMSVDGPLLHPCLSGGLWEASASIVVGGRHIASWLIGQVRDGTKSEETMRAYAKEIGVDEDTLLEAFREIPVRSKENFQNVAQVLFTIANQLSQIAYQNLLQARFIEEKGKAEEALRESEARYESFVNTHTDLILVKDEELRHVLVNQRAVEYFGMTREDLLGKTDFDLMPEEAARQCRRSDLEALEEGKPMVTEEEVGDQIFETTKFPLPMSNGRRGVGAIIRDITEAKRAVEALKESRAKLREAQSMAHLGSWAWDVKTGEVEWTEEVYHIFQLDPESFTPHIDSILERSPWPEDNQRNQELIERALQSREAGQYEQRFLRPDGSTGYYESTFQGVYDEEGDLIAIKGTILDITKRKETELALSENEKRFRSIAEASTDLIALTNEQAVIEYVSPVSKTLFRCEPKEMVGRVFTEFLDESSIPKAMAAFQEAAMRGEGSKGLELTMKRADGSLFIGELNGANLTLGEKHQSLVFIRDITERKQAERELKESEERYKSLHNASFGGIVIHDQGMIQECNYGLSIISGYAYDELIGMDGLLLIAESSRDTVREKIASGDEEPYEGVGVRKNGEEYPIRLEGRNIRYKGKDMRTVEFRDISRRKKAEEELKRRESELSKIFDVLPVGLWFADKDGTLLRGNPAGVSIWGAEPHVPIEEYGVFKARRLPSREEIKAEDWSLVRTIRDGETILNELIEIDGFDGVTRTILNSTAPVLDENGTVLGAIVVNQDITEQKQMEQQLLQAQKMESVGRLAGGVAHDFNNLLTGITGHVSMALMDIPAKDPMRSNLEEIQRAADSAAALTRQLLSFSRKQIVEPKVLDLNQLIKRASKMLGRLIGEDVSLKVSADPTLGRIRMDPGQVEQILVNLAVNARDAMPDGGMLTLESRNVTLDESYGKRHGYTEPGEYVMLAVSDNGTGMDEETKEHLFEPFFTTKEQGKGTGLGLATVYGAVKQGRGSLEVYSELSVGTTFKIYFPRVEAPLQNLTSPQQKAMPKGMETVFLVEDEELVRKLTHRVLQRLGYRVFAFQNGEDALDAFDSLDGPLHLLLTDIIMPGMNGRVLSEALQAKQPGLLVLFTSGYTEDVIAHHGVLEEGLQFIGKPYTPQSLAAKVRRVLDGAGKK